MANERLRDAMLKAGLTPADMADRLSVNGKTVERWITQERAPYPRHRHAIATLLGERESYLWPDGIPAQRAAKIAESELVHLYPRRSMIPADLWMKLLLDAAERVDILVYVGLFLPEQEPRLIQHLRKKAEAGVKVRLLLGDPGSEAVARRGAEEGIGDAVAVKVRNVLTFYEQLRGVTDISVRFHETTLYTSIYRFDAQMIANTHVYGFPAAHAPAMHLRQLSGGDLFGLYADSFERVWSTSRPVWDEAVAP